jgi:hypothetical protein
MFSHGTHIFLDRCLTAKRSLPFVAEKLGELLLVFLNLVNDDAEDEREKHEEDLERRRISVRNKVQSVSRMLNMFKKMREEREAVSVTFIFYSYVTGHEAWCNFS